MGGGEKHNRASDLGHVVFYLDASPQQASLDLLFTPMLNLIGGQFPGCSSFGVVI